MLVVLWRFDRELLIDLFTFQQRIGIHSGPVTAGVLRGDRARFQLFGDTMVSFASVFLELSDTPIGGSILLLY